MYNVLNKIWWLYYAVATIVVVMIVFFVDFESEELVMLGLIGGALLMRFIMFVVRSRKDKEE